MSRGPYDLVVVGGGITGAGIARDAVLRGLRVALFEKSDFGSGTSSKSSKLVHGGLRYLEQGEIGLVFESVSERRVQTRVAPHIVRPLPFLVPIYENSRVGLELMNLGLWIYDTLALFRSYKLHRTYRGERAARLQPGLKDEGLTGAIEYYDCFTDDARLVLENILDAAALGADCRSYTEVTGVERQGGRVRAVRVRDRLTGAEEDVRARSVILATGPWTDRVLDRIGAERTAPLLRPTKGVHLVFPREVLPLERACTVISPDDGRVMFAIPWRGRTVLGTTDTDFHGDPDEVHADAADAAYLCKSGNHFFPGASFRPEDVIATWAGLRPLIHEEADTASQVSREHQIYDRGDGVFWIAGGKLTTYRIMASEMVEAAVTWLEHHHEAAIDDRDLEPSRTKRRSLPGADGLAKHSLEGVLELAAGLAEEHGVSRELAEHLCTIYGVRARSVLELAAADPDLAAPMQGDLPYLWAEVAYSLEHEMPRTIDDVLSRRVPLLLVGRDQGLDVAERVADMMTARWGWSAETRERELERYRATVAKSRLFRTR